MLSQPPVWVLLRLLLLFGLCFLYCLWRCLRRP